MTDIAKVTVAKDALSSLQESINIGKEVLQRKLSAYQKKIVEFEKAKEGVRLILRLQFGKMLLNKISPEFFPAIAQYDRTEGQHSLPTIDAPTHA